MINIYIDDSGTKNLKEVEQPVFLFSAVCIKNSDFSKVNSEVSSLLSSIKRKIDSILLESIDTKKYTPEKAHKVTKMIIDRIIGDKFELHCAEMLRGDGAYMILDKNDRESYIENALQIIRNNNIRILTVVCSKQKYIDINPDINIDILQDKACKEVVNEMIKQINNYLIHENEQGCIIADKGNDTIKKIFIPIVKDISLERLSSEVLEKESHESLPIQLADVCAYTSNIKCISEIRSQSGNKYKKKNIANNFYKIISNNIIIHDISNNTLEIDAV